MDIYIGWSEVTNAENCFESCIAELDRGDLSKAEKSKLKKRIDVSFTDYLAWTKLDRSVRTSQAYGSFNSNILAIRFSARINEDINTVGFTLASRFPPTEGNSMPPAVAAFSWLSKLAKKSATPIRLIGLPGLRDFVYQWKLALAAWPSARASREWSSLVSLFDGCGFEFVELIAAEDCRDLLENASQNLRRGISEKPESEAELELRDLANDYSAVRAQWRGVAVDSMQDIQCILAVSTLWGKL